MQYNNKSALSKPVIGKVIHLNKRLAYFGRLLPNGKKRKDTTNEQYMTLDIRRYYFYPLLEKAELLFTYAMRQVKGKDYLKRSIELIEEIQAQCVLIMEMQGWNNKVCAELDLICDDIADQLQAINAANQCRNH